MIKFGPSGNSESFYNEGHKSTLETPKWLKSRGLNLFEYSFGKGVLISEPTARAIGVEAEKEGIEITVHAPYFINFANPDDVKGEAGYRYLKESMNALRWFNGSRVVFHSGTETKQPRDVAVENIIRRLKAFSVIKKELGFENIVVCPETMGKLAQIGDLDEVIDFCLLDESFYPCIDFGHINARSQGGLKTYFDYEIIIKTLLNRLGEEKTKNMHVHFSKILYTAKGEVKHLTFADDVYGPEFLPLAEVIYDYKLSPYVLSESAGTQAEDAAEMKRIFESIGKKVL